MSEKKLWAAKCPKCKREEVTSCNCVMLCNCGTEYAVIVTELK